MSEAAAAPAPTPPPPDSPHPDGLVATGPTAPTPPAAATQPPVTINVNGGGSANASPSRPRSEGTRDPLHRLDGYSTTSEFLALAEQIRRDHLRRHDAYLQHAAILERGIKNSSNWPWALDKITTARRASRPLRQNAGSELDAARRISATVRTLVQMKDAPRARTRGFDATR